MIDVVGRVAVNSTNVRTSMVGRNSISVVPVVDGCVDVAIVLVGELMELMGDIVGVDGGSVVTGIDDMVDVIDGVVVEGVDVDVDVDVVVVVVVLCSIIAGCKIMGAGIITCTIDGDGCNMLFGRIGIWAFSIGNSGMGGVK